MHFRHICNSHFGYFSVLWHFPAQHLIDIAQIHVGGAGQRVRHSLPQRSHVQPSGVISSSASHVPCFSAPLQLSLPLKLAFSSSVSQAENRRGGQSIWCIVTTTMGFIPWVPSMVWALPGPIASILTAALGDGTVAPLYKGGKGNFQRLRGCPRPCGQSLVEPGFRARAV